MGTHEWGDAPVIKYLGSKRRLVPIIGDIASRIGGTTAVDLFTGTTRVAQGLKRKGLHVTACDSATYSEAFARCYVETDADAIDQHQLAEAIRHLSSLPGYPGYFTETFCIRSRFFQPHNGERIDAIRDAIETDYSRSPLYPILLTSLVEAADRVDSTTGLQMAYLKDWADRSFKPLELRAPELISGSGRAIRGDACELAAKLDPVDVVYLDPPYNQHRYFTNYHVWESLLRWDAPEHYGVACKRVDAREESTKSPFNSKRTMPDVLRQVIESLRCRLLMLSYNDEAWLSKDELSDMCSEYESVAVLAFDSKRYVGAQIGIHSPAGKRVGSVKRLRNVEYLVVAGIKDDVTRAVSTPPRDGVVHQSISRAV